MTWTRCKVCNAEVQRDSNGRLLAHTRIEPQTYRAAYPVICEGYTRGARAT